MPGIFTRYGRYRLEEISAARGATWLWFHYLQREWWA